MVCVELGTTLSKPLAWIISHRVRDSALALWKGQLFLLSQPYSCKLYSIFMFTTFCSDMLGLFLALVHSLRTRNAIAVDNALVKTASKHIYENILLRVN